MWKALSPGCAKSPACMKCSDCKRSKKLAGVRRESRDEGVLLAMFYSCLFQRGSLDRAEHICLPDAQIHRSHLGTFVRWADILLLGSQAVVGWISRKALVL